MHLAYMGHDSGAQTLGDLVRAYSSLSIVGMCKNAGKTTVLNAILRDAHMADRTLALTSIGRDGEAVDLVTGTKKPGIYVRAGSLIATAAGLLRAGDITREILATTGMDTPLGEVVILRALSDGNIQLAGPSAVAQLVKLSRQFRALGAEQVIIDGAVGRKSLGSRALAEATVLCTGASCGRSMDAVVRQTAHACQLLVTREAGDPALVEAVANMGNHRYLLLGCRPETLAADADLLQALKVHGPVRCLYVEGALTDQLLDPLIRAELPVDGLHIMVRDASRLMLSPDALRRLHAKGWALRVLQGIHLAAVAVNPYSAYGGHFDADAFLGAVSVAVPVPVVNVKDSGGEVL